MAKQKALVLHGSMQMKPYRINPLAHNPEINPLPSLIRAGIADHALPGSESVLKIPFATSAGAHAGLCENVSAGAAAGPNFLDPLTHCFGLWEISYGHNWVLGSFSRKRGGGVGEEKKGGMELPWVGSGVKVLKY